MYSPNHSNRRVSAGNFFLKLNVNLIHFPIGLRIRSVGIHLYFITKNLGLQLKIDIDTAKVHQKGHRRMRPCRILLRVAENLAEGGQCSWQKAKDL